MEHNEILGMESALNFINKTLIDKYGDITLQDILEIHRRVIGNVDPVEAGIFRRTQVYVSNHQPPPPSLLSILMTKFISWLNSSSGLHPVRHAALAHYKLVFIHPFGWQWPNKPAAYELDPDEGWLPPGYYKKS